MNNAAICVDLFPFLSGIHLGVELLGHVVRVTSQSCLHGYINVCPQSSVKKVRGAGHFSTHLTIHKTSSPPLSLTGPPPLTASPTLTARMRHPEPAERQELGARGDSRRTQAPAPRPPAGLGQSRLIPRSPPKKARGQFPPLPSLRNTFKSLTPAHTYMLCKN